MWKAFKNLLFFIIVTGLVACGGGAGNPEAPTLQTGRFIDSAVGGLRYKTPSQSGFTDDAGDFKWLCLR